MSFATARARLADAKYRHLGAPALWNGAAVRVRVVEDTKPTGQGFDKALIDATFIEVAVSAMTPHCGDQVILQDDGGNTLRTYSVIAEPKLINNGLDWSCEADV